MPTTASPPVDRPSRLQIFSAADQALARQIVREFRSSRDCRRNRLADGRGDPVEYYLSDGDLRAAGVHIRFDEAVLLPRRRPRSGRTLARRQRARRRAEPSTLSSANDIMETALAIVDLDRREMLIFSPAGDHSTRNLRGRGDRPVVPALSRRPHQRIRSGSRSARLQRPGDGIGHTSELSAASFWCGDDPLGSVGIDRPGAVEWRPAASRG